MFNKPLEDGVHSAFMTSLTDIVYRNQETYKSFVLKVCKEELLTMSIVMYFPKNFYFKQAIDKKLSELATAGFVQYWIQEYVDMKFIEMRNEIRSPTNLQLKHLFGIFNIWMIGLAISLLIFFIEISSAMLKRSFRLT